MKIFDAVTETGAGEGYEVRTGLRTLQAVGSTTSGAGSATIVIQVSNDGANWLDLATITLTLSTTPTTDGMAMDAPWQYMRGNVTAISGTGAAVTLTVGV